MIYDGKTYDRHNRHIYDISFYLKQAFLNAESVLELCCGTGRITIPIAETGIYTVGVDNSESMLKRAKDKSKGKNLSIDWIFKNCLNLNLNQKFDLIILPFNSFHHFTTKSEIENLLGVVRKHLTEDGFFIFDIYNPIVQVWDDSDLGFSISESLKMMRINWYKKGRVEDSPSNIKHLFPKEADKVLKENGLKIIEKWGAFNARPFENFDRHQIFKAQPL